MMQLIPAINNAWKTKQNEIQNTIAQIKDYLKTNLGLYKENGMKK